MIDSRYWLANAVATPLLPLIVLQGRHVRRVTPRLPEAAGPTVGRSTTESDSESVRVLVLGESTVAGVGAASHEVGLAGQVGCALAGELDRSVAWEAVGRNGATAAIAHDELVPRIQTVDANVVVIALGVNDVLCLHSPSRWRRDLIRLVLAIRERVGKAPVVLAAMPPMGRFPAFPEPLRSVLGARAAALGRATPQVARELDGVVVCAGTLDDDERLFAVDRFHPSELGYREWGRIMSPDIANVLRASPYWK